MMGLTHIATTTRLWCEHVDTDDDVVVVGMMFFTCHCHRCWLVGDEWAQNWSKISGSGCERNDTIEYIRLVNNLFLSATTSDNNQSKLELSNGTAKIEWENGRIISSPVVAHYFFLLMLDWIYQMMCAIIEMMMITRVFCQPIRNARLIVMIIIVVLFSLFHSSIYKFNYFCMCEHTTLACELTTATGIWITFTSVAAKKTCKQGQVISNNTLWRDWGWVLGLVPKCPQID